MTLGEKQRAFSKALAQLILYAYEQGYEINRETGETNGDPDSGGETVDDGG